MTFVFFKTLTVMMKEEVLQLAIEKIIAKQQDIYPILTCIRNFSTIKNIFKVLIDINICMRRIVSKYSKIRLHEVHVKTNKMPSIYSIEILLINMFDLEEVLLDTIVLNNKIHDHKCLNLMYQALSKIYQIQNQLCRNYQSS